MGVYIWNKLPSEYQEVEYIQSDTSNVQYINTGYLPTSNPKIELDFMYINGVETTDYVWFDIYGRRGSTNSTYIGMYINNPNGYVSPNYAGFDPGQNSGVTISKNTRYYHIQDRGQFYLNGTKYANASTTNTLATDNYPVFLFGNNIQGTVLGRVKSMRVYSCKMWNDGVLVRNFVPCYRKSDSVIGLYDLVNNQFYTNSGTGTFTKGSDVNTYREKEMKNAYIGEVYEYSYDFRNKSVAICQADGWVFSTTSGRTFNSNGITGNSTFGTIMITPSRLSTALSNAKKVTLVIDQFKNNNSVSNRGRDLISSSNSQASGSKADLRTIVTRVDGTVIYNSNYTIANGEYIVTTIIDLENKKLSINYPGIMSREDSITDAQVTAVKGLSKLRIQQDTSTIKSVSCIVE